MGVYVSVPKSENNNFLSSNVSGVRLKAVGKGIPLCLGEFANPKMALGATNACSNGGSTLWDITHKADSSVNIRMPGKKSLSWHKK